MLKQLFNNKSYILKATCLFWLIGKILSYKLWLADRFFPIVPPFDFLLQVPNLIHLFLLVLSVLLIVTCLFYNNKHCLIALVAVELLSCFLDQNRWQPWEYQYVITIIILILNYSDTKKIMTWLLLICAATYFYSGVQKFNQGFITILWQDGFLHRFFKLPMHIVNNKFIATAGYMLPTLEVALGLSLLVKQLRKIALILLIIMHLIILVLIGPLGLMVNIIVWPWNLLMMMYLLHLSVVKQDSFVPIKSILVHWNLPLAIIWCLFPILNFVGLWDNFLSFSLYSGRIPNMEICVEKNLPKDLNYYFHIKPKPKKCDCENGVNIQIWGMDEILVPPLPQERVYHKVKRELEKKYPAMKAKYYVYRLPKSVENYTELK